MPKASFKVLAYNQAVMNRFGLSSSQNHLSSTKPRNEFYKSFMLYFNTFFITINIILSGINVFRYWPEIDLLMEPITIGVAAFQGIGMYLSVGLNMEKVYELFHSLQQYVDNAGN